MSNTLKSRFFGQLIWVSGQAEAKEKANAVILGLEAAVATGTPLSFPSTVGTSSTAPGSATKTPATPQGFQVLSVHTTRM